MSECQFGINNTLWTIKLINKNELKNIYREEIDDADVAFCYGVTIYPQQIIFINEDMKKEQQIKTLKHELTHCYIWNSALYNVPNYTEEMVCDLVSCSNNFINKIVELFEMMLKEKE